MAVNYVALLSRFQLVEGESSGHGARTDAVKHGEEQHVVIESLLHLHLFQRLA